MPKILKLINSCNECSHKSYVSGGVSECGLNKVTLLNTNIIPNHCPLSDYPSDYIHSMESMLYAENNPDRVDLLHIFLSSFAKKLKKEYSPKSGIKLKYQIFEDGKVVNKFVRVGIGEIMYYDSQENFIKLFSNGKIFYLRQRQNGKFYLAEENEYTVEGKTEKGYIHRDIID